MNAGQNGLDKDPSFPQGLPTRKAIAHAGKVLDGAEGLLCRKVNDKISISLSYYFHIDILSIFWYSYNNVWYLCQIAF